MVYLLEVEAELASWRERGQRKRRWLPPVEAAESVSEPRLASMILALGRPSAKVGTRHGTGDPPAFS